MLGQKFRVRREDNWDVLAEPSQCPALRTLGGPLFSKTRSNTRVDERLSVVSPGPQNRSEKCMKRKESLTPPPRNRACTRYAEYHSVLEMCGRRAAPTSQMMKRRHHSRLTPSLPPFLPPFSPPFPSYRRCQDFPAMQTVSGLFLSLCFRPRLSPQGGARLFLRSSRAGQDSLSFRAAQERHELWDFLPPSNE